MHVMDGWSEPMAISESLPRACERIHRLSACPTDSNGRFGVPMLGPLNVLVTPVNDVSSQPVHTWSHCYQFDDAGGAMWLKLSPPALF